MRFLIYLIFLGTILYLLYIWSRHQQASLPASPTPEVPKPRNRFRWKKNPFEVWVQVYETASMEEARMLQARLQEDEVECIIYEQGKKDIHGNPLRGVGIAVPKTAVPHAQSIISRMPV